MRFFRLLLSRYILGARTNNSHVSPTPACAGTQLSVRITSSVSGNRNYTAALSDASGSFANPIASRSKQFNPPPSGGPTDTIHLVIPINASNSSNYAVRVSVTIGQTCNKWNINGFYDKRKRTNSKCRP